MSNGYTQKVGYTVQKQHRPKPNQANPGNMPTYQQDPPREKDPGPWASAESARITHREEKFNHMPVGEMAHAKNAFGNNPGSGVSQSALDRGHETVPMEPWEPMYTNEPAYGGYQNYTGEPEYSGGFVERNNVLDRL